MKTFSTTLSEVIARTGNVKSFRARRVDGVSYTAGQFMQVTVAAAGGPQTRTLSFSSSPRQKDYFEFTKKITGSPFSQALDALRPGAPVTCKLPMGRFTLREGEGRVAFLSGGIGITPLHGICEDVFLSGRKDVDIVLFYGNRSFDDIAFREDLALWEEKGVLRVVHVLEAPAAEGDFSAREGYITGEMIKEELPDYASRLFYACGPPAMVAALKEILTAKLGLPGERVVTENFAGY